MMKHALMLSAICLSLAACTTTPPVSTGYLPAGTFADTAQGQDLLVASTNDALFAFAHPAQMEGRPADMALAIASLDALAGQFASGARWAGSGSIAAQQLVYARTRVREILGVPEDTQSQSLIDHLVVASRALNAGDQQAALAALSGPDFTKPPAEVLALLGRFPYVSSADSALMAASNAEFPQGGGGFQD
jgi:hypothetical protein